MEPEIERRIERIAEALPIIVDRLRGLGFTFRHPEQVLPGPEPDVAESIRRIETEVGPVPYAVACFWTRVGSVDLAGSHDEWRRCDYPDPLVVYPPSAAIEELEEYLADRDDRLEEGLPYLIPIAPDFYHKENVGGGMWYNVNCPATTDDPIVNDERHNVTFLDYLDLAMAWGGFPGLDIAENHNWPVGILAGGIGKNG